MTPETVRVDLDDEPTNTGADAPTEVVAVTGGVDLATCPGCGSVNAVQRLRCARCGAALHDEVDEHQADAWDLRTLPSSGEPESVASDDAVRSSGAGRSSRGLAIAIVVIGAVLGGVLGAWVFGVGPFERTPGVGVPFNGEDYEGQAETLAPRRARTTEVRPDADGRSFGAAQAVDGDLATAWVAVDPDEARLEFAFDQPVWITQLEFGNGDQFDDETFQETARVRTLDLDFGFDSMIRATLLSASGRQVVRSPEPVLTDRVVMDVVDVTDGTGVALSEVTFVGFVAHDGDAQSFEDAT